MKKKMKQPDPKAHLILSLIKSGARIVAALMLFYPFATNTIDINTVVYCLRGSGLLFATAEVIGIVEELV